MAWNKLYKEEKYFPQLHFDNNPKNIRFYYQLGNNETEGVLPVPQFKLSTSQLGLLKFYENNRFCLVKKARETGETTCSTMYLAVTAMLNKKSIMISVHNSDNRSNILSKIMHYLKLLGCKYKLDNNRIILENDSKITVLKLTKPIMGYTLDISYISEACFDKQLEDSLNSLIMSTRIGGQIILASTSNFDSYFNHLYNNSTKGLNDFKTYELKWFDNPVNTVDKLDVYKNMLSPEQFRQEIQNEYIPSSIFQDIEL